jgi:hypothetical protein
MGAWHNGYFLKKCQSGLPGESVEWPEIPPNPREVYRAYLDTVAEELVPGEYNIRVDIYNSKGEHTVPGSAFRMLIDTRTNSRGGVTAETATAENLVRGGFQYVIHIDNSKCIAQISPPTIRESGMDTCGFLRYDPAAQELSRLSFPHPVLFK